MDDRRPKRLNIPQEATPPADTSINSPRRLSLPDAVPTTTAQPAPEIPKRLKLPDAPPQVAVPVEASPRPRALNLADAPTPPPPVRGERAERAQTLTDILIEKARQLDQTIQPHRIRGRIDTILNMSVTDILDWGNRNLAPLVNTSNRKTRIASEISRINASQWLEDTKNASCKTPSGGFFKIFDNSKPPSYYEAMLQKTRTELLQFVKELDEMKKEFSREVVDLHLDAVSLLVCWDQFPEDTTQAMAQNKARSLMSSHQTAMMLDITIEQSLTQCAQFIQQIDSLLSNTIPQWKIAFQNP